MVIVVNFVYVISAKKREKKDIIIKLPSTQFDIHLR